MLRQFVEFLLEGNAETGGSVLHVLNWAVWVKDLEKRYGDVKAVDGISFGVSPGEVFGMLGPNGAGKTTTIEIVLGLRTADSGDVRVLGMTHVENHRRIASAIGAQLQTSGMYPTHTVREMIQLFSDFYSEAAPVIAQPVQMGMMFLSSTLLPAAMLPEGVRAVVRAIPLTYVADALRQTISRVPPMFPLWVDFAAMAGWIVLFFVLAVKSFRWE